jgi:hypothetical protein
MGVRTTLYAVPKPLMKKLRGDNNLLVFLFGVERGDAEWVVPTYEFDKGYEETIGILGKTGHPHAEEALDLECAGDDADQFAYEDYGIRVVPPASVKKIAKEIADATFKGLKAKGLANGVADYYGEPIPADDYQLYVGDITVLKRFFKNAAADARFIVISAL